MKLPAENNISNPFFSLLRQSLLLILLWILPLAIFAQALSPEEWTRDGNGVRKIVNGEIVVEYLRSPFHQEVIADRKSLTPAGHKEPLNIKKFVFAPNEKKILLFTNTKRVWRYDTKGDYWLLDLDRNELRKLGTGLPSSSLMFAKFSPDSKTVAYVCENNLYVEGLSSGSIRQITSTGDEQVMNGTFDWAYEEEFGCRDGFRWSPDGHKIAFWNIDAHGIPDFYMINNIDSVYPFLVPLPYPKVGQTPSTATIVIADLQREEKIKIDLPGDPSAHYIPRMEWTPDANHLILQQLNRNQNQSKVFLCDLNGTSKVIFDEHDETWIDTKHRWNHGDPSGWYFLEQGNAFIWVSEQSGWRNLYRIGLDGSTRLLTPGSYDMIEINHVDEANNCVYFMASPDDATQQYLYRVSLAGGEAERVTPVDFPGTNAYAISPNGKLAIHKLSSTQVFIRDAVVSLPAHTLIKEGETFVSDKHSVEFFKIRTSENVEMDGWMVKPTNFDPAKKYPVLFYVYGEPAGQTVTDSYGVGVPRFYEGDIAEDGYLYISVDNRGTRVPKGRAWRKAIYGKIGQLNIKDQALAAKEILKWPFVDSTRIAVWGISGGGSSTLNLLFQYPEIYGTGIAIAAITDPLLYDNVYQERYMGLPWESKENYIKGSPLTYVNNLQGNLLYIHGTLDDNVHYQNAELLINELIKHNKYFQFMAYPNRSHALKEGIGTRRHLNALFTKYLKEHCPPGGR